MPALVLASCVNSMLSLSRTLQHQAGRSRLTVENQSQRRRCSKRTYAVWLRSEQAPGGTAGIKVISYRPCEDNR